MARHCIGSTKRAGCSEGGLGVVFATAISLAPNDTAQRLPDENAVVPGATRAKALRRCRECIQTVSEAPVVKSDLQGVEHRELFQCINSDNALRRWYREQPAARGARPSDVSLQI